MSSWRHKSRKASENLPLQILIEKPIYGNVKPLILAWQTQLDSAKNLQVTKRPPQQSFCQALFVRKNSWPAPSMVELMHRPSPWVGLVENSAVQSMIPLLAEGFLRSALPMDETQIEPHLDLVDSNPSRSNFDYTSRRSSVPSVQKMMLTVKMRTVAMATIRTVTTATTRTATMGMIRSDYQIVENSSRNSKYEIKSEEKNNRKRTRELHGSAIAYVHWQNKRKSPLFTWCTKQGANGLVL